MTSTEPLYHSVNWNLDYNLRLGKAWSRFMRGLQNQQLWASRCDACDRTYVPPKSFCESCFEAVADEDWRQVEPVGTIKAATIVYQGFDGGPEAPYAVGAIEVDGTDTMLMHFVGGVDLTDAEGARTTIAPGTRVRAVWSQSPDASITDIEHFVVDPSA
ncbi:Zn-ribbon domain-containing OB-fold protein [Georgenia sp. SYP-B2076]|uniref:Zn-ribbon domain-containing OB-fold protein n=1 Tax=Georgenia sp. SYP-B2076 TaxID=2495881 RepID=UPI000F8ED64D|nr:Zn-ribbon domain-containing OB-fold protein [Georgenia sp. SYP-B2076]